MLFHSKQTSNKSSRNLHSDLEILRKTNSFAYLAEGANLYELKKNDHFKTVAGGYSTWAEYLRQPTINLTPTQAERMIQAYCLICLSLGKNFEEGGEYPISAIKFLARKYNEGMIDADDFKSALEASKSLSFKDFKEFFQDVRTKNPARTYDYMIMRRVRETNNLEKVHGIESEKIKHAFNLE